MSLREKHCFNMGAFDALALKPLVARRSVVPSMAFNMVLEKGFEFSDMSYIS